MRTVTALIPCYQERHFIRPCLDSVRAFEVPEGWDLEILVLDGGSSDGTREILAGVAAEDPRIRVIDNPRRTQSTALNLGIRLARGKYVVRLDAHSVYPRDYLRQCIETAVRTGADNVGGVVITRCRGSGYQARMVQALTTHWFGVGNSGFRIGAREGPADTVPYGCFRRDVFERIGLFDERLVRAQDYEFNRRILASGGTVWLNPAIRLDYYQQPDLLRFLRKQLLLEGPYIPYMWHLARYAFAPRHAVTGLFSLGTLLGLALAPVAPGVTVVAAALAALYLGLAFTAAVQQAVRYRCAPHIIGLPAAFALFHFVHGLGVLLGVIRVATAWATGRSPPEPWPGAGATRAWPRPQALRTEPVDGHPSDRSSDEPDGRVTVASRRSQEDA